MPCFLIVVVIMDGHNSEALSFWLTISSQSCTSGTQPKERMYFGKRNMKIFKLMYFGKACTPISRQNINRCYSAAIFWELSRQNKQTAKKYLENFTSLILRILQLFSREVWIFLKSRLILNTFYCLWIFVVNKLLTYLTCAYLKK